MPLILVASQRSTTRDQSGKYFFPAWYDVTRRCGKSTVGVQVWPQLENVGIGDVGHALCPVQLRTGNSICNEYVKLRQTQSSHYQRLFI